MQRIQDSTVERIVELALDSRRPPILRLKASETLLLLPRERACLSCERLRAMESLEQSPRLRKNYALLLGQRCSSVPLKYDGDDPLLQSAFNLAKEGKAEDLFSEVEPDILRKKYYGWDYPDDAREFAESGYY